MMKTCGASASESGFPSLWFPSLWSKTDLHFMILDFFLFHELIEISPVCKLWSLQFLAYSQKKKWCFCDRYVIAILTWWDHPLLLPVDVEFLSPHKGKCAKFDIALWYRITKNPIKKLSVGGQVRQERKSIDAYFSKRKRASREVI